MSVGKAFGRDGPDSPSGVRGFGGLRGLLKKCKNEAVFLSVAKRTCQGAPDDVVHLDVVSPEKPEGAFGLVEDDGVHVGGVGAARRRARARAPLLQDPREQLVSRGRGRPAGGGDVPAESQQGRQEVAGEL